MKHPYYEILIAIAEGKEIQWSPLSGNWVDISQNTALEWVSRDAHQLDRFRIKPATITINGVKCEGPVVGRETDYCIRIDAGSTGGRYPAFVSIEARDAAYAALIKPFESDK